VRLRLSSTGSAGLGQSLVTGDLDVAFLSLAGRTPGGLTTRVLAASPMVLVTPVGHRLAARGQVGLDELADEEFIDFPPGYGNRDLMDRAFAMSGIRRRVSLEVSDVSTAAAFVRHGLGLAFLPAFAGPHSQDLSVVALKDHELCWTLAIATSSTRRPSAAVRAWLELVDAFVAALPGMD
jgi:DNA-binding transcriptional LysR family regulator